MLPGLKIDSFVEARSLSTSTGDSFLLLSSDGMHFSGENGAGPGCCEAVTLVPTRNRAGWNAMNRGIEV
jgi:hypothetical protein